MERRSQNSTVRLCIRRQAEVAALREDKARLDAYEKQVPDSFDWTVSRLDDGRWTVVPLRIGADSCWGPHYPTARAALDAARKEEPGDKSQGD